jgi:hypothetical protein
MAFTFVVEDGTGVAGANSYVSVAEADDILAIDARENAVWQPLTTPDKELALANATRYLDDNYQWFGKKTETTQFLKWPRKGMRDCEGQCIADAVIPIELKRATARLAVWLLVNNGEEQMNTEGLKRFRSDDIEIEWQAGYYGRKGPDFLSKLLICFGWGPNDRGFKPIIRK